MAKDELRRRINEASERIETLPRWAKDNLRFIGGRTSEYRMEVSDGATNTMQQKNTEGKSKQGLL